MTTLLKLFIPFDFATVLSHYIAAYDIFFLLPYPNSIFFSAFVTND